MKGAWTDIISNMYSLYVRNEQENGLHEHVCNLFSYQILHWHITITDFYMPDSTSDIVMGYRLNNDKIGVRFLAGTRDFTLLHRIQTRSGSDPVGNGGSPEAK
jgi:hypothetical protein